MRQRLTDEHFDNEIEDFCVQDFKGKNRGEDSAGHSPSSNVVEISFLLVCFQEPCVGDDGGVEPCVP